MRILSYLTLFSAVSCTIFGLPLPEKEKPKKGLDLIGFIQKNIAAFGTLGIIASLAGVTYLGTKLDESLKKPKSVNYQELHEKFNSLPAIEREYLKSRLFWIGHTLPDDERKQLEAMDAQHSIPLMEMPDLSGVDDQTRKSLKATYARLKEAHELAIEHARKSESMKEAYNKEVREAFTAQYQAAVLAATDWKEALQKANIPNLAPAEDIVPEIAAGEASAQVFPAWRASDFGGEPKMIEYDTPSGKV